MGKHITDKAAKGIGKAAKKANPDDRGLPGPSTNPATNLIITDIALRGAGRIVRNAMQKGVLRAGYDPKRAKEIVDNRTLLSSLLLYGVSKVATRSLPGAMVVGGGLLAKTLFDRSQTRRQSRRKGKKTLDVMTDNE